MGADQGKTPSQPHPGPAAVTSIPWVETGGGQVGCFPAGAGGTEILRDQAKWESTGSRSPQALRPE